MTFTPKPTSLHGKFCFHLLHPWSGWRGRFVSADIVHGFLLVLLFVLTLPQTVRLLSHFCSSGILSLACISETSALVTWHDGVQSYTPVSDPCSKSACVFLGSEWGPARAPPVTYPGVVGGSTFSVCVCVCVHQLFMVFLSQCNR